MLSLDVFKEPSNSYRARCIEMCGDIYIYIFTDENPEGLFFQNISSARNIRADEMCDSDEMLIKKTEDVVFRSVWKSQLLPCGRVS